MHITYRPLTPDTDIPRMAEIANACILGSASAERLAHLERRIPPNWTLHRTAAADKTGRLLGWSEALHAPMFEEGRWDLKITVDPSCQGQGIGTHLYEEALAYTCAAGATRLHANVADTLPQSLRFAKSRGFRVDRHLYGAVLDLDRLDDEALAGAGEMEGIRITSMAEIGDTPEARRQLWALEMALNADVPGFESQGFTLPYEAYCQYVFDQPWYRPENQLLALDGHDWVGMASLRLGQEDGRSYIYHNMTGVVASHRGRHVALALKLAAVRCARQLGAAELRTDNDSENAPMVALNRKLGYQPRPGEYKLIKDL